MARDYSKFLSSFWTGETGKKLRGHPNAQVVASYLFTNKHASMLGIYYIPLLYISHETGLPLEGVQKGLLRAFEAGFCAYDEDSEHVFVYEMARIQVGDELKPNDNRVKAVNKEYHNLDNNPFLLEFFERYGECFHIEKARGLKAPLEPLRSQEQEQEQEQESSCRKTKFSDEDMETAEIIFEQLKKLNPEFKAPSLKSWAGDIRKLREIDRRETSQIREVFAWANNDPFWQTNILSPAKLRKQWDQLVMKRAQGSASPKTHPGLPEWAQIPKDNQSLDSWAAKYGHVRAKAGEFGYEYRKRLEADVKSKLRGGADKQWLEA